MPNALRADKVRGVHIAIVAENTEGDGNPGYRVKVKLPWLDCRVGAAFPDAVLHNDAGRYELKDVVISGCARESVALTYKKVTVRAWNPETKEL